jgi:hypothetical protein
MDATRRVRRPSFREVLERRAQTGFLLVYKPKPGQSRPLPDPAFDLGLLALFALLGGSHLLLSLWPS